MLNSQFVKQVALGCGFEIAGIASARPTPDFDRFSDWLDHGYAGEMRYLADHRAALRRDPRSLLPTASSILCVGKLYNGPQPYSTFLDDTSSGWIARYAWGEDYHDIIRTGLEQVRDRLAALGGDSFQSKICVDTAPLLERSFAKLAGLGWIGKNTCLINQQQGSWFFLGEILLSLDLDPDRPAADRCGTCTRCIEACPTDAFVPDGTGRYHLDARRCISYFTIELKGTVPEEFRQPTGRQIFGCDICQDVCPWNRKASVTADNRFASGHVSPPLEELAALTELQFQALFRTSPVKRSKYSGFLRNVATAMGNSGDAKFVAPLTRLAESSDPSVAVHARWALDQLAASG